jgi:hypothetical protein
VSACFRKAAGCSTDLHLAWPIPSSAQLAAGLQQKAQRLIPPFLKLLPETTKPEFYPAERDVRAEICSFAWWRGSVGRGLEFVVMRVANAVVAAVVLSVVLTGCVGGVSDSAPSAEQTATVAPMPTPITGDRDGDGELSEHEKQVLAKTSPRDYVLADGSTVVVDPALPLPAEVVAHVEAEAAPWIQLGKSREADSDGVTPPAAGLDEMYALLDRTAEATGKPIAFVFEVASATGNAQFEDVYVAIGSNSRSMGITPGDAATVAAASMPWVNGRNAELIVFE